jgi:hypothetical protein
MMKWLPAALASLVLTLGSISDSSANEIMLYDGGEVFQISDSEHGMAGQSRINGVGDIVWSSLGEGLFLYDGTTTTLLSSSSGSPASINDAGEVVWAESGEIHLYDGTNTIQLTNDSEEIPDRRPQINNRGEVAWLRGHGVSGRVVHYTYDVFLYDGTEMIQLIDDTHYDHWPKLNNAGQVVWQGGADEPDYYLNEETEILLYDGATTLQLTNNSYYDGSPQINDAGHVVWEGIVGTDFEIFLYDGTAVTQLTNNLIHDREPHINNSGLVVWSGGLDFERSQIFLYDGASVRKLTPDIFYEHDPMISDNGQVVWTRQYLYLPLLGIGPSLYSQEIMIYDGSKIASLSKNLFLLDRDPYINEHGQVVWESDVFQPWQTASVMDVDPKDISRSLNYSFALFVPIGIVVFWRRLPKTGSER